jgi:hypothetical protein
MDDEKERVFGLRDGLCADLENDWRIHTVHADPNAKGVFYIGGWPYNVGGWPLVADAPRLLDAWELGVDKYIDPERRHRIARAAYGAADNILQLRRA